MFQVLSVARRVSICVAFACACGLTIPTAPSAQTRPDDVSLESALVRAGDNRGEIERALREVPGDQREGLEFLVRYMPQHDLQSLSAAFLLEDVDLAYTAWQSAPWHDKVSKELFFEHILPYAVVNEVRAPWRGLLRDRIQPLVHDAESPSETAVRLNQNLFPLYGVKYSTERSKPDQNPLEVISEQKASCSGLSILLISACRAAGVPARFTGVPLWADSSGNHSWVEIWDEGWHFTGAAEPDGDRLDSAWFETRAAEVPGHPPVHAIYATQYSPTGVPFPLVWDESIDYVPAVDVTARYAGHGETIPADLVRVRFVAYDGSHGSGVGRRVPAQITVYDAGQRVIFEGTTQHDHADMNDHLTGLLPRNRALSVHARYGGRVVERTISNPASDSLIEIELSPATGWGRPRSTAGR